VEGELFGELVGGDNTKVDLGTLRAGRRVFSSKFDGLALLPFGEVIARDAFHAVNFDVERVAPG
jgi:hypothetical protein